MPPFYSSPIFLTALWTALLTAIPGGVIGTFVVVKRISFIAGSISHAILGGMGLFIWLQKTYQISWLHPLQGAFLSALASAWLIAWTSLRHREREEAVLGAIWSTGMAIGVVFLSMTPGGQGDTLHFLFGNILWVTSFDLLLLGALNLLVLFFVATQSSRLLAICFDPEQALLQGVRVERLYVLLLSLVAVSIVLLTQMIGTVLVITLLTLPSMLAGLFTKRLFTMMALASFFSLALSFVGLFNSFWLNWPPGSTIALSMAAFYLLALLFKKRISSFFEKFFTHKKLSTRSLDSH